MTSIFKKCKKKKEKKKKEKKKNKKQTHKTTIEKENDNEKRLTCLEKLLSNGLVNATITVPLVGNQSFVQGFSMALIMSLAPCPCSCADTEKEICLIILCA